MPENNLYEGSRAPHLPSTYVLPRADALENDADPKAQKSTEEEMSECITQYESDEQTIPRLGYLK
jgi:uncharacterized protein (DUF608 family)